jgi:polysaccharide export outer membrane protein
MITLPLVGDIRAAGYRPDELKGILQKATTKYLTEPNVTVVVRTINSRKVYITGEVTKPGAYQLTGPQTVMQLIAMAGGLTEYADSNAITVMRTENGRQRSFQFRYKDVAKGKALAQNIQLIPGDTVVVP